MLNVIEKAQRLKPKNKMSTPYARRLRTTMKNVSASLLTMTVGELSARRAIKIRRNMKEKNCKIKCQWTTQPASSNASGTGSTR